MGNGAKSCGGCLLVLVGIPFIWGLLSGGFEVAKKHIRNDIEKKKIEIRERRAGYEESARRSQPSRRAKNRDGMVKTNETEQVNSKN